MADSARAAAKADSMRPKTSAASLFADSAAADSLAVTRLTAEHRRDLDLRAIMTESALRDTTKAYCQPTTDSTSREIRHRLRGTLPSGAYVVLFVRADRASGVLQRVELVRRPPSGGGQRGYSWDRAVDESRLVVWAPGRPEPEVTGLSEESGTPRALRGLGRRLLLLPCRGQRARSGIVSQ